MRNKIEKKLRDLMKSFFETAEEKLAQKEKLAQELNRNKKTGLRKEPGECVIIAPTAILEDCAVVQMNQQNKAFTKRIAFVASPLMETEPFAKAS